jgi:FtsZ-interacting cell division protein ZipA
MSTGAIIAIIVAVLIILAILAFVLPRMRRSAQVRARQRELEDRRERVATEHRDTAGEREREAEAAEQRARMAQAEAERERAEAQMHSERADMHERGLADHELVDEHEREHFAPAMDNEGTGGASATEREGGTVHEPVTEYDQGRIDEREAQGGRFERGSAPTEGDPPGARRA